MNNNKYPVTLAGVGKYLPETVITNDDLAKLVDTNDEWIYTRSGIKERHVVSGDETASSLAVKAALDALGFAGESAENVDMIICATSVPDNFYPAMACEVQAAIGASKAVAFDIVAACSGVIYAMKLAKSLIENGDNKCVLIIGADVHSRIINWEDRSTCVLFGDGAGALLLKRSEDGQNDILAVDLKADGVKGSELKAPVNGKNCPLVEPNSSEQKYVTMNGREIYKFAVSSVPESIKSVLEMADLTKDDIDNYVLHQANIRIIHAIADKLGENQDKFYVNLQKYGNTSSASIPIALTEAVDENKIKSPSTLVFSGFGAGLTWGTAIVRWRAEDKRN